MTLWERERARHLAHKGLLKALDDEKACPRNYVEAAAKSALQAQKGGNLALWVEVCLAVAQELSESLALTQSFLARVRKQSTEKNDDGLLCTEVRQPVHGGYEG